MPVADFPVSLAATSTSILALVCVAVLPDREIVVFISAVASVAVKLAPAKVTPVSRSASVLVSVQETPEICVTSVTLIIALVLVVVTLLPERETGACRDMSARACVVDLPVKLVSVFNSTAERVKVVVFPPGRVTPVSSSMPDRACVADFPAREASPPIFALERVCVSELPDRAIPVFNSASERAWVSVLAITAISVVSFTLDLVSVSVLPERAIPVLISASARVSVGERQRIIAVTSAESIVRVGVMDLAVIVIPVLTFTVVLPAYL